MAPQLAPNLEQSLLDYWPELSPAARYLLLHVLDTFLPPDAPLLEQLVDLEVEQVQPVSDEVADERRPLTETPAAGRAARRQRQLAAYALQTPPARPRRGAWQRSFGIFADDPVMAEVFAEAHKLRDAEPPAE